MTPLPRLLVLTDRTQLPADRDLVTTIAECVDAGLTHVVLRELDLDFAERAELAVECAKAGARVVAAHHWLPGCVGVHLPSRAEPIDGPWGRSCHSADEVDAAGDEGAGWVMLSPFAASASKPGHGPALPAEAFAGHEVAVFALAGIDAANAHDAIDAGAHGVAVMGVVMRADRPGAVVRDLLELVS